MAEYKNVCLADVEMYEALTDPVTFCDIISTYIHNHWSLVTSQPKLAPSCDILMWCLTEILCLPANFVCTVLARIYMYTDVFIVGFRNATAFVCSIDVSSIAE